MLYDSWFSHGNQGCLNVHLTRASGNIFNLYLKINTVLVIEDRIMFSHPNQGFLTHLKGQCHEIFDTLFMNYHECLGKGVRP